MLKTLDEIDEFVLDFTTENVDIGGTSRIGTLKASRNELERQFGKPDTDYPKTTYHWQIRFPDGSVITIYDYRERNRFADGDDVREWSIGGRYASNADLLRYLGFDVEIY
jgi:hypothetical protein